MLTAVQVFNNPNILFKSESFIVLSIISWTYLLHAFYKSKRIEYRHFRMRGERKKFDRTSKGAFKYWELERCLNDEHSPIDAVASKNLRFLIGLRHEIEHQMTTRIDDYLSARFQACCLNYNDYIKKLFGPDFGIDKHLSFSLQFSSISPEQIEQIGAFSDLPANIFSFISAYDEGVTQDEYNDLRYSYRVLYVPKMANRKGQADKVIEFIPADSPEAQQLNKEYVIIKEREKNKYLPSSIVSIMKQEGFRNFNINSHTDLWKSVDAKGNGKGYGTQVAKSWYWYDTWLQFVREHCRKTYQ